MPDSATCFGALQGLRTLFSKHVGLPFPIIATSLVPGVMTLMITIIVVSAESSGFIECQATPNYASEYLRGYCKSHLQLIGITLNDSKRVYGVGKVWTEGDLKYLQFTPYYVIYFFLETLLLLLPAVLWKRDGLAATVVKLCKIYEDDYMRISTHDYEAKQTIVAIAAKNMQAALTHSPINSFKYLICKYITAGIVIMNNATLNLMFENDWGSPWSARKETFKYNFPPEAMCFLTRYGSSGSVEYRDSVCSLPANYLTMFSFLGIGYIHKAILLVWCLIFVHEILNTFIWAYAKLQWNWHRRMKLRPTKYVRLCRYFRYHDMFLLKYAENMLQPHLYSYLVDELASRKC